MTRGSRWAIVGTGTIATRMATDLASDLTAARHVATLSRDRERAREFGARFGSDAGAYHDVDELVRDAVPDVAYIATPHTAHAEAARAFLDRGVAVLVEKPMACTAAEAAALFGHARARGVYLCEAMWTRFNPVVRALHEELQSGAIGTVQSVRTGQGFAIPFDPTTRMWNPSVAGGAALDMSCYAFAIGVMAYGALRIDHVSAAFAPNGVDAEATVDYVGLGGGEGRAEWSFVRAIAAAAELEGTDGSAHLLAPFQRTAGLRIDGLRADGHRHVVIEQPLRGEGFVPMIDIVSREVDEGRLTSRIMPPEESLTIAAATDQVLDALAGLKEGGR
jgi:Predicted dehydrogenases and related proteins